MHGAREGGDEAAVAGREGCERWFPVKHREGGDYNAGLGRDSQPGRLLPSDLGPSCKAVFSGQVAQVSLQLVTFMPA